MPGRLPRGCVLGRHAWRAPKTQTSAAASQPSHQRVPAVPLDGATYVVALTNVRSGIEQGTSPARRFVGSGLDVKGRDLGLLPFGSGRRIRKWIWPKVSPPALRSG
ncbi:hypothetical protein EJB05_15073, partial [Eragrostis curvula]